MQYLKQYGEQLVALGYTVLPIRPGTKRPDLKNWPQHETTAADVVAWYSNGRAGHGAGINARNAPAIDVDVLDPEVAQQMSDAIDAIFPGERLMTRTGLAPKFLVPFRSDEPFRKMTSHVYTDGTNEHKVEILGDGQQWVAYHVHPDTERPYKWFDGLSDSGIRESSRDSLPELKRSDAQRVIDAFEVLAGRMVEKGAWSVKAVAERVLVDQKHDGDPFAAYAEPTDLSAEQVTALIHKVTDYDDRDQWLRIGRMVHHHFAGSEEGFEMWEAWSTNGQKYNAEDQRRVWDSFGHSDKPETLRALLKEFGQPPADKAAPTEADLNFRFYAGDAYSEDFVGGPELVEDVLPERGIAMVYGPSGKGKTFWTLDLAFRVHNGVQWRDKDVKQGDVMYVAAEAGRGIKKRIQAIKVLNPEWRSPFIADAAPNLSSMTSVQAVRDAARAVGAPAMVIVDTMSASFEGDDSSQKDVAQMIRNLKILADDLQCLVLFVHHTTKDGGSFRGSGVLYNDVDAVLELEATGEGADRKQWVTQKKHREGEDGKAYPFSLKVSAPLAFKANGKPITSCTVEQENYKPEPKKEGRKSRSGDFETSANYQKARHFLHIIQDMCGMETGLALQEDEVIEAIQKDKTVNPMEEPDYPLKKNIIPTLRTLASLGKISKEGRIIRVCRP
jgi:KaiC/GvpD/RAD55 family RecA-like ATPase